MDDSAPTLEGRARSLSLVRDVVILVVGILAAFSLDSWWDNRVRTSQRTEDVTALIADFTANRNQLSELIARQQRVVTNSRRLASTEPGTEVPADSIRAVLSGVFSSRRFEPLLASYLGIVQSGALNRPEDRDVRAALAEFSATTDIRYSEEFADALYLDLIDDYPIALRYVFEGPASFAGLDALLGNPSFRTALNLRATAEAEVERRYSLLLERVDRILELLKEL